MPNMLTEQSNGPPRAGTDRPLDRVLSRWKSFKRSGGQYRGPCPAKDHTRKDPLSIRETADGTLVITCHAGCHTSDVVAAFGLEMRDLYPNRREPLRPAVERQLVTPRDKLALCRAPEPAAPATPPVIDPDMPAAHHAALIARADLLDQLCERRGITRETIDRHCIGWNGLDRYTIPVYDDAGACVNIRQYKPDGEPKMLSWRRGYGANRLYPLDAFAGSDPIILCEGEWDALIARQAGLNAVTATGGAGNWPAAFAERFAGRDVVIAYDADDAGRAGAANVATHLFPVARSVKVLRWEPGRRDGFDVSDFFRAEYTAVDFGMLAAESPLWTPSEAPPEPTASAAEVEPTARRFRFLSDTDLGARPDPEMRVDDTLTVGGLATIIAPYNNGKTFLALDLALSVAAGRKWHEREVKQGRAVYLSPEGVSGLKKRVQAWKKHHEISGSLPIHFLIIPVSLLSADDPPALVAAFAEQLPEPPALIVVDTLARAMLGGNENSTEDMGKAIAAADAWREQTGATVLLVHHTGWEGEHSRGHSSLPGAVDTEIRLKKDGDEITVECGKQKDAAPFPTLRFRLTPVEQSAVLVHVAGGGDGTALPVKAWTALRALKDISTAARPVTNTRWKDTAGMAKTTFYRAQGKLLSEGLVHEAGDKWYVTVAGYARLDENRAGNRAE